MARYGANYGGGDASDDALAAGLEMFAQYMMNRQAKKEDRKSRQEDSDAYEKALEAREMKREERAERKRAQTPVERRVYQGPQDQGPPELRVDELNAIGESVGDKSASSREKQDFASSQQVAALAREQDREKKRREDEDREFDRKDKETRTKIASRNADSSARRAAASEESARSKKPPPALGDDKPITTKDALTAIDRYRNTLTDEDVAAGKKWQDKAREDGVDPTGLLREANRGTLSAGPGGRGQGHKKVEPALGKKADKPKEAKKDEGSFGIIKAGYIDKEEGMQFIGGDPNDPKNWKPVK
jgi:hypothetical protein